MCDTNKEEWHDVHRVDTHQQLKGRTEGLAVDIEQEAPEEESAVIRTS